MSSDTRARRYLLGQSTDEESSALEHEYFGDEPSLDAMAGAEEALIEDYLSGALSPADRERFDRHYLASPEHRARVEIVRRLTGAASRRWYGSTAFLATAAALLLAVSGALWMTGPRQGQPPAPAEPRVARAPEPAPPAAPRIFAVSLPAVTVRGASEDAAPVVVPSDADVLRLELHAAPARMAAVSSRAVIETVAGAEVWHGTLSATPASNGAATGRVDVPLDTLHADDYIVVWLDTDAAGAIHERGRYVLRLRARGSG